MKSRVVTLLFVSLSVWAQPPTPESHFGHAIGVDRELLDWDKVVSYYQSLAKTSDKIAFEFFAILIDSRLGRLGKT